MKSGVMTSFQLIVSCTKRLIKYLFVNHFAKLKYFRNILDLKETTLDVKTVFCHVHIQENLIGQFY